MSNSVLNVDETTVSKYKTLGHLERGEGMNEVHEDGLKTKGGNLEGGGGGGRRECTLQERRRTRASMAKSDLSSLQNAIKSLKDYSNSQQSLQRENVQTQALAMLGNPYGAVKGDGTPQELRSVLRQEKERIVSASNTQSSAHRNAEKDMGGVEKGTSREYQNNSAGLTPGGTCYDDDHDVVMADATPGVVHTEFTASPTGIRDFNSIQEGNQQQSEGPRRDQEIEPSKSAGAPHNSPATPLENVVSGKNSEETKDPISAGKLLAEKLMTVAQRLGSPAMSPANVGRKDAGSTPAACVLLRKSQVEDEDCTIDLKQKILGCARDTADCSTEERPRTMARRCSGLHEDDDAPILDLAGFDAHGDRRRNSIATPLLDIKNTYRLKGPRTAAPGEKPCQVNTCDAGEVDSLRQRVVDLEAYRQEAVALLQGYQGSIANLQDKHSKEMVQASNELKLMKSEVCLSIGCLKLMCCLSPFIVYSSPGKPPQETKGRNKW